MTTFRSPVLLVRSYTALTGVESVKPALQSRFLHVIKVARRVLTQMSTQPVLWQMRYKCVTGGGKSIVGIVGG
jgi:hypothetical protein